MYVQLNKFSNHLIPRILPPSTTSSRFTIEQALRRQNDNPHHNVIRRILSYHPPEKQIQKDQITIFNLLKNTKDPNYINTNTPEEPPTKSSLPNSEEIKSHLFSSLRPSSAPGTFSRTYSSPTPTLLFFQTSRNEGKMWYPGRAASLSNDISFFAVSV